ncbi:hypothetical protein EYF80_057282 [Liparis tanakae]|uniref:Uncharacterized protein n=1 Tax=Liparis tanakae TaxID=230148 RepID=A0A4Z2EUF4_9TELE|nr:hypothetical protein EYF80_057282 [Liparis tanakae]
MVSLRTPGRSACSGGGGAAGFTQT